MKPRIETTNEKKLIGKRLTMSLADYKASELWESFMPRRKEVVNNLTNDLVSMSIYKPKYFVDFNPTHEFEKWATVEVPNFDNVPDEIEMFILPSGLYAVFDYKGLNTDLSIFQYIFGSWLPTSNYDLDDRPQF
jgi:AraC family transcriptional regulator